MITKEQALTENEFHTWKHKSFRRNGRTRTWVTRPDQFRVPVKFGLYGYASITDINARTYHIARECEEG